MAEIEK